MEVEATSSDDEPDDSDDYRPRPRQVANEHTPRTWKSAMEWYHGPPGANPGECRVDTPPYNIVVRREMNETEIPALEIDYEKRGISFHWRGMYTMFFREEDYIDNALAKDNEQAKITALDLHAKLFVGEITMQNALEHILKKHKASDEEARRNVRRKRFATRFAADRISFDPTLCELDEEMVLKSLAGKRVGLSMCEFSNDSEGEDHNDEDDESQIEDDGEGEGNEGDGWEDMDDDERYLAEAREGEADLLRCISQSDLGCHIICVRED